MPFPYILIICFITGQHIYKEVCNSILQEEMTCERESSNCQNQYAIKLIKESKTVGLIPQLFLNSFSLILLSGSSMKVRGTGKQEKQRGNGLKAPYIIAIKISEHMYVKVETIINDLCGRLV